MIVLERASYRYPGSSAPALPPTSLVLHPGEIVGVRGPNESGKTTLCLVASGLAPVVLGGRLEGKVLIDGRPSRELAPHELAVRCGALFDNPTSQLTDLHRTVLEEVAFGPCNLGLPAAEVLGRAWAALKLLGAEHLAGRHPARLSGGETQLVALAGLLALEPPYLVLDEPVSRLDPERGLMVAEAVIRASRNGVGVLWAEHDPRLLARCDQVLDLGR